jgi:pyruvate,orthophosphate dikinase
LLLGGKGAGLAEMTRIGLPVPGGFTITTEACAYTTKHNGAWPSGLEKQVKESLAKLERTCKKKLGDRKNPLLVSVRSGAAASMPGMMETILNLGLNDVSVEGLAHASGNRRFAFDAYRRLIMMYGATAKHVDREKFDHAFDEVKRNRTAPRLGLSAGTKVADTDVNAEELEALVDTFKKLYQHEVGEPFPQDPFVQLRGAIDAVFGSWMSEKAVTYRRVEKISGLIGTAVNVCQMVFGNMGDDSGTGVCFTRDPSTGENTFYGDLLINAQGEDVVAGIRTPVPLADLINVMPEVYDQLEAVRVMLEVHYAEMQDLEFTIERGKLYMLQCRTGKRSPAATFKIAVDMATKGVIAPSAAKALAKKKYLPAKYVAAASKPVLTREQAINRVKAVDVERLFYPVLDPEMPRAELEARRVGSGINAVPGAACGEVAFSAHKAEERAAQGAAVILVRHETSPEDVGGMSAAKGILTATGGKTSHAAVVARGWGKCCIVGCGELHLDYAAGTMKLNGKSFREGEKITLDGSSGEIYGGEIALVAPTTPPEYETLMGWCDERRRLGVRTNADTPADARKAIELGAEGIGLCRTEHMFFDAAQPQRIIAMRQMILAENTDDRRRALDTLIEFQRRDFEGIFSAMDGLPITIRLLDPPLHEFLPQEDNRQGAQDVVDSLNAQVDAESGGKASWWDTNARQAVAAKRITVDEVRARVRQLHEANPMLGHRGCRLCITYPEILDMQVRAIIEAACNCAAAGIKVLPEIMIPLSIDAKELGILVDQTRKVADAIIKERKSRVTYLVGTMIETPRAALLADRMAEVSEFFSFGTNDLTQMTMALSRDDAGRFLPDYVDQDKAAIFKDDPFQTLDTEGVGMLMEWACAKGRSARKNIKLGICGEHGGDAASVFFCHTVGLDYVSCSPYRVPIARLAAAQAAMRDGSAGRKGGKAKAGKAKAGKAKPAAKSARKGKAPVKKAAKTKARAGKR